MLTECPTVDSFIDSYFTFTNVELQNYNKSSKPILDYVLDQSNEGESPYVSVSMYGNEVKGLLDSGANQIFINDHLLNVLLNLGVKLKTVENTKCTVANNQELEIIGYMDVPIQLKNKIHIFQIFVIPQLRHKLVLGTVFWIKMNLIPDLRKGEFYFGKESNDLNINSIKTADDLTLSQRHQLNKVIEEYFESSKHNKLGSTSLVEHIIKTDSPPIKSRYYPVSPFMQKLIDEEVTKMLELGVIEKSDSGWSSPILMVPKKDNSYRFCVDFRKLNAVTEKWAYPLPMISSILDKLGNARYLTTLDIQSAYWQINMSEDSKKYTAFTIPGRGLFQFRKMPFGLSNAPATFQSLVDKLFDASLEPYVFKYLDDIVVVTPDFESHLSVLAEVLKRLKDANLTLNKDKCQFCRSELKFLGYVVNRNGLYVDPSKVSAIVDLPRPKTSKAIRQFVGMVSWYRKFIPNMSSLIKPLTNLTQKKVKFTWSPECEQAFTEIKNLLVSAPILSCPNFDYDFILQCDASSKGLGSVLSQYYNGREHVICYLSRTLTKAEQKYTITELECLSVLWSMEKVRCYIEGKSTTIITDHHSLIWLNNLKNPQGRLGRWALRLQQFDYKIIHRPGKFHAVPDCLSRAIPEISEILLDIDDLDPWYKNMISKVLTNPLKFSKFRVSDDKKLYKHIGKDYSEISSWKLVLPKSKRKEILKTFHDNPTTGGHLGIFKTYHRISDKYFWPGMKSDISKYVNKCKICSEHKPEQKLKAGEMGSKPNINKCWQYIATDLIGPLPRSSKGNQFILVVCDFFSKFSLFFPLRRATATSIVRIMEEQVFLLFGVPEYIKCDNGVQYKSKEFKKLMSDYNVKINYNPLYHPEPNYSERVNRVIKTMIASYVGENHKKWDLHLSQLGCAYRTAKHEVTEKTPYLINFGCEMITNGNEYQFERDKENCLNKDDVNITETRSKEIKLKALRDFVRTKLKTAHEKTKHNYNLRHRPVHYKVGDFVWKKEYTQSDAAKSYAAKLGKKYTGPFKIKKKLGINTYELEDDNGISKGCWHVKDLKPDKTIDDN